ncbi:MAG TPA: hypothetical protein VLB29_08680 [Nocardioidaceae bacterium]|nr:hypothetical protein [Nocardioidaceae bacterium]
MLELFKIWWVSALAQTATRRDERGDVPGWVLITVMTAGLVTALWAVAGDALSQMLSDALRSVSG